MSNTESQKTALQSQDDHVVPRRSWRWKGTLAIIYFTALINAQAGYDVSNAANIQSRLYEAFGRIELLSWISLSYSLALFSVMFLVRHLTYNFDLRWLYLGSLAVFLAGATVAGAAQNMAAIIVGRVIMGVGGAFVQQINMFYISDCAPGIEGERARKAPQRISIMSASWAVGLIIGGPVGSAFSERVTWRWAFLLNLPCVGATLILACICVPKGEVLPDEEAPLRCRWNQFVLAQILLNMAVPVLLALGLTFSGSVWHWDSHPTLAIWIASGVVSLLWVLYLWAKINWAGLVRSGWPNLRIWSLWVCSACAGASYAVALYYFPLYFAFAKGADALQQTLWVLPFVLAFITSVAITGQLLPVFAAHKVILVIFAVGGAIVTTAGGTLAAILNRETPTAHLVGFQILMGSGVGLQFQHGIGICNAMKRSANKLARLDSIFMCNLAQMGGIAITLAAAGSIFQNVGYRLLARSLGTALTEEQIRALLAGNSLKSQDPALLQAAADIVSKVIAKEFYVVAGAGGLCFLSGLLFLISMRREDINFK
ncbi:Major facilitator superfamily domain, general substrate transporter [Metarhizium guizhouense ARSEF 977]|uniref:Major facilitator superfamily domain, general substrate transporter n=1 Tax=Metarhizium guizhouense (strain ARSEF 977) TaxID=1276136 RepID=A0A0B4HQV7_METGA|nr:Major facilitator superfamily domain, general substrate transporter [Metarhizium guizhouense ARSEF 977]